MTRQEIENSGYAIPMYDVLTNTRIWMIEGKEYITRNIFPNHQMKLGNRIVNCARISDVIYEN